MVIIEGQSDQNALFVVLTEAFEKKYGEDTIVLFAKIQNDDGTVGGDITSRFGVIPSKLQMLMNKLIIMPCISEHSLMPKYVTEIVQIIDMDGVYIDDSRIILDKDLAIDDSPLYFENGIYAVDPITIAERNARKRANIETLLDFQKNGFAIQNFYDNGYGNKPTTKVFQVPYSLYYFSCNLDHYICGDPNLNKYMKIAKADEFARNLGADMCSFVKHLINDADSVKNVTSDESWDLVMRDNNSLKRLTNINLLIDALQTVD